jgi:hypothetical protein
MHNVTVVLRLLCFFLYRFLETSQHKITFLIIPKTEDLTEKCMRLKTRVSPTTIVTKVFSTPQIFSELRSRHGQKPMQFLCKCMLLLSDFNRN